MQEIITPTELLANWQGNRRLTRKVIEVFPEKDFFEFSIGGMRPFADLTKEFLAIAVPGLNEILGGEVKAFNDAFENLKTKDDFLKIWDESTEKINEMWPQITHERFREVHTLFGQYTSTTMESITYFIENEIHHRGQGYVYLRALGIQPPFFWER